MHLTPDIHTVYHLKWNIIQNPINSWCNSAVCSRAKEQCCSNTKQEVKVSHTARSRTQQEVMQIWTRSTCFSSFATHSSHFLPLLSLKFPVSNRFWDPPTADVTQLIKIMGGKKKSKQFVGITLLNSYGINYCLCLPKTLQKRIKTNILSKYPCRCYVNQLNIVWHVRPKNY